MNHRKGWDCFSTNKDVSLMKRIAERERAPFYEVGETTGNHQLVFTDER